MTNQEVVNHNIGLTFDLVQSIIDNPSLIDQLPDDCEIEFVEKDFPVKNREFGDKSKFIRVKNKLEVV